MIDIFIDTSAFFAASDTLDQNHIKAKFLFNQIKDNSEYRPIITNLIFNETVTLIRYKIGILPSIKFGNYLIKSKEIDKIFVNEETESKAWEIFSKYKDKDFSFIDCSSFAVMENKNISKAF